MKRVNNLYNFSIEDINFIYKKIRNSTKNKRKIIRFEYYYSININRVKNILDSKNYEVGKYNIFLIRKPKYRIIMSQSIADKLINHLVAYKILIPTLDKSLINTNVATRTCKGTHYGIKYLKKYLNSMDGKVYALKFDISKYFYNIDHKILINLLKEKIKDKDGINILTKIINSTDSNYINGEIDKLKTKEKLNVTDINKLKEINDIPYYEKGKGLPIGNMTSQIMAIFYLSKLDHFIKEKLHIKYYIRYMDDGLLLSNDKAYLRYCLSKIKEEIYKYKLKLNNKTKIINVSKEGLEFLGFKFYKEGKLYLKVKNNTKKRFKRKIKNINKYSFENQKQIKNSYKAHLRWGNCYSLCRKYMIV